MAISNKLRYQVLRRDNYTCRYCGAFAPVAVLVIDHVTPRKEGGQDVAENLVTACQECNNGKGAMMPELSLVSEVERSALQWSGTVPPEPDEDDLFELEVYADSLRLLEALPAVEVLRCIERAYLAAENAYGLPYRPTHSELIFVAGGFARDAARHPGN